MKQLYAVVCHPKSVWISSFEKAIRYLPLDNVVVFESEHAARDYIVSQQSLASIYCITADERVTLYRSHFNYTDNRMIRCKDIQDISAVHFICDRERLDFTTEDLKKEFNAYNKNQELHELTQHSYKMDLLFSQYYTNMPSYAKQAHDLHCCLNCPSLRKPEDELTFERWSKTDVSFRVRPLVAMYQKFMALHHDRREFSYLFSDIKQNRFNQHDMILMNISAKRDLITAYHRVKNASKNYPGGCHDVTVFDYIRNFLTDVNALTDSVNDDYDYRHSSLMYKKLHHALDLVADVLGLDETGKATGVPRMSVAAYKAEINKLSLQSTTSYIMATLGYSMLAIALALSPVLAIASVISGGAALGVTAASGIASWGLFSMANKDVGRRCLIDMKTMIDCKAGYVEEQLIDIFKVEMEPAPWMVKCFSNL